MIELQPKPRSRYQPPRERLAHLLDQLSQLEYELDPEKKPKPTLKLAPKRELHPRESQAEKAGSVLKLAPKPEPKPIAKPEQKAEPEKKAAPKHKAKPAPQRQVRSDRARDTKAQSKGPRSSAAKPDGRSESKSKSKPKSKARPKPDETSFGHVLRTSARKTGPQRQPRVEVPYNPWGTLLQTGLLGGLVKAWSWLNSKYRNSAAKKLRLSEMVPLGDKRFVALVVVDDREFLVGGA